MEAPAEEGGEPGPVGGTESVRSLGGLWVVCEGRGEMPDGSTFETIMTLGYDAERERYVGTFVGSMMAGLWSYYGALDETGRVLTLDTEGPNINDPSRKARYQDEIEIVSAERRVLRSRIRGDDGDWRPIMTANYRRTG